MIAHVVLAGEQLVGIGLLGVVAGWLAADATRGPRRPTRRERRD